MFWRITVILGVGLLASACGFAGAAPGPMRPQPYSPPAVAAEVIDPAPIVRGTMRPYQIRGRWYTPEVNEHYNETGIASWYGDAFHGRPTATGEIFDMHQLTAAHTTLPLPSLVEVTNLQTGQSVIVRVNDRGPFVDDRVIDLSRAAADALGVRAQGLARVRVRYVGPAPRLGGGRVLLQAEHTQPPAAAPREPGQDTSPWFVQVGTFGQRDNAEALSRRLGREGRVRIEDVEVQGRQMFRVLLGPWTGREEAELQRSTLAGQGLFDAILVRAQ